MPTSEPRFYMALYPCLALLVGVAIQLCVDAGATVEYHKLWKFYAGGMALLILVAGPVVLAGVLLDDGTWSLGQPVWFAVVFCGACLVLAKLAWESRLPASHAVASRGVLGIAVFLGMCSTGLYLNQRIAASSPNALEMARLMQNLPSDARLVSLGPVTHLFNWMYGKPIPALPIPAASSDVPQDLEYFCIMSRGMERPNLCFEWDEVGAVICDRCPTLSPEKRVVVGRRHAAPRTGPAVPVAAEGTRDGALR